MRDFNTWLQSFKEVIAGYKYYTAFEKIYRNVDGIKVQLCLMNSLIGSHDIEKERQSDTRLPFYLIKFTSIKNNNPEVYSCEQGQQGLTLANIGNYLYVCKYFHLPD